MKAAYYSVAAYAVLVLLSWGLLAIDPWILANINSAAWCRDVCDAFTFYGKMAHLVLVYPGIILVAQFMEFSYPSNRVLAALVALLTALLVFAGALILNEVIGRVRRSSRA